MPPNFFLSTENIALGGFFFAFTKRSLSASLSSLIDYAIGFARGPSYDFKYL